MKTDPAKKSMIGLRLRLIDELTKYSGGSQSGKDIITNLLAVPDSIIRKNKF